MSANFSIQDQVVEAIITPIRLEEKNVENCHTEVNTPDVQHSYFVQRFPSFNLRVNRNENRDMKSLKSV